MKRGAVIGIVIAVLFVFFFPFGAIFGNSTTITGEAAKNLDGITSADAILDFGSVVALDGNETGCFNDTDCSEGWFCYLMNNTCLRNDTNLCGNEVIDDGEECDGSNLGGFDCAGVGYDYGNLSCFRRGHVAQCNFDTSDCFYNNDTNVSDTTPPVLTVHDYFVRGDNVAEINVSVVDPEGVIFVRVYGPIEYTGMIRDSYDCNGETLCGYGVSDLFFKFVPNVDNRGDTYTVEAVSAGGIDSEDITLVFYNETNVTENNCSNFCDSVGEECGIFDSPCGDMLCDNCAIGYCDPIYAGGACVDDTCQAYCDFWGVECGVLDGPPGTPCEGDILCDSCGDGYSCDLYQGCVANATNCFCPNQGDLNADGQRDTLDLALLIDVLFAGANDTRDSNCSTTRSDWNNDGQPDVIDLSRMIQHLFENGEVPCDPCNPVQDNCFNGTQQTTDSSGEAEREAQEDLNRYDTGLKIPGLREPRCRSLWCVITNWFK